MKNFKIIPLIFSCLLASGCAHKINIDPDVTMISRGSSADILPAKIGYHFPAGAREKEVITPGGGGDRVAYNPYRDIEAAFEKMLRNIFRDVSRLETTEDAELDRKSIDLVASIDIQTNSSSPSPFTWPPTWFSVDLTSKLNDRAGNIVDKISVTGEGKAEFPEFAGNHGLAGKRASFEALAKMQSELLESSKIKNNIRFAMSQDSKRRLEQGAIAADGVKDAGQKSTAADIESKLKRLNDLYLQGLITKTELSAKRLEILNSL